MRIACDIDGVIANVLPYLHLLPQDWEEYFKHTHEFNPIKANVWLIQILLSNKHFVAFVTGRPESNREQTESWLKKTFDNLHGNSLLLMRQEKDNRPGHEVKLQMYRETHPDLILDDEPSVIKCCVENKLPILQVHGYRDGELDGIPFIPKFNQFSFKEHATGIQTPEQTLQILTYELGHVIEYNHKARIYGATGYYSEGNQKKEMSDLISMSRYYCEQKGWNFEELMKFGEEAYMDRMEDIKKHGIKNNKEEE